jgi:hypothetical protein
LLRRRGRVAIGIDTFNAIVSEAVVHRRALMRLALISCNARKPGHSEDRVLVTHELLGELIELRPIDMFVGGLKQCSQRSDLAQICVDADLQITRVTF